MKVKYIFSWLVFSLLISAAYAQNTIEVDPAKKDSLQKVIKNHPKDDEEKVRLLNEYARECFYNKKLLEGFEATRAARLLSEKLNFEGGIIMYNLTLSAYFGDGNKEMHNYYQMKAKWLSKSKSDKLTAYYSIIERPKIEFSNDFEASLKKYTKLLNHFEAIDDKEIQTIILGGVVTFNYLLKNHDGAIIATDRAIKLYTELDQIYPVFLFTTYKMTLLRSQGKTEEIKRLEVGLVKLFTTNKEENAIGLIAFTMAQSYHTRGRNILAIEYYLKSIEAFERNDDKQMLARCYYDLGLTYEDLNMNSKAVDNYVKAEAILKLIKDSVNLKLTNETLVFPLIAVGNSEEAKRRMSIALRDTINGNKTYLWARYYDASGQILKKNENYTEAIPFFKKSLENFSKQEQYAWAIPYALVNLTDCYFNIGDYKLALQYGLRCLERDKTNPNTSLINKRVTLWLSKIYEKLGNKTLAYNYLKIHQEIVEESEKLDELNRIADEEVKAILDKSQKEIDALEKEKELTKQKSKTQRLLIFSIAGAFMSALILALILYRNNKSKQKANSLLQEQKEEIETTLEKLEATQTQLIQAEKMASLGELTAGIAHEIQNPLNFVNNFSEVNKEMLEELKAERLKPHVDRDDQLEDEIIGDVIANEEKISHHGKRADAIVKGMLQHSQSSSGKKEPTNINALVDEYLRLAYHGLRAKDKSFNASFETDLDASIGKVNIVPQDMGRVIMNLVSNAFYAVNERKQQSKEGYEPTVTVSSKKVGDSIQVIVADNGNGIPQKVLDKIFQPFFTTKPTGQGTGLGLSLSYDIVKAHGGEIKVESVEGEGTTFKIELLSGNKNIQ